MLLKIEFPPLIFEKSSNIKFNPLNAKLNPICHLLALLGDHHILHVSRIRVNNNPSSGGRVVPCGRKDGQA
jgi:hypothetical protein